MIAKSSRFTFATAFQCCRSVVTTCSGRSYVAVNCIFHDYDSESMVHNTSIQPYLLHNIAMPLIILHPFPSLIASRTCQHFFEHQESHRLFLRKIFLGRWSFDGIAVLWGIANASLQMALAPMMTGNEPQCSKKCDAIVRRENYRRR